MIQQTLALIKSSALAKGAEKDILSVIRENGLKIVQMKHLHMSESDCYQFYDYWNKFPAQSDNQAELAPKDISLRLIEKENFVQQIKSLRGSAGVFAIMVEGENSVERLKQIAGAENLSDAQFVKPLSVRAHWGTDLFNNALHTSDSFEQAQRELRLIFG